MKNNNVPTSIERSALRFSVIIPLEFHRGQADNCFRAWLEAQTFPRDQFEVVVACPEDFPESEATAVRAMLAEHDQFLRLPGEHDMTLCEAAALKAVGEVLFFTESHVYPEPDVLEVADRALISHPEWSAFSCRSIPITHNLLSQIEAELYDKVIQFAMKEHPWRKVLDQCFVIRREPYFEAGGFESRYGHFAEWLLSARLYQLGYRVGYIPKARLHHYYIGQMGEWTEFTNDFVDGQMRYLADSQNSPAPELALFEEVQEWGSRLECQRVTAIRMVRMIGHALTRGEVSERGVKRGDLMAQLRRWSVSAVLGAWRIIIPSWLGWIRGQRELHRHLRRGNKKEALRVYGQCWNNLVTLRRGLFLRKWARNADSSAPELPRSFAHGIEATRFPGLVTAPAGAGFYLGEQMYGETLRWSEPVAYIELPLDQGKHRVTLRWLPLPENPAVQFYLNEKPIPAQNLRWKNNAVDVRLNSPAKGQYRLGWVCKPARAPGDIRALGLPLLRIDWRREKRPPLAQSASSLFFLHIRKTAGVSMRDVLINRFPAAKTPYTMAQPGKDLPDTDIHPLITGHLHFGIVDQLDRRPAVFTMLREPLDRALSAYYFYRSHDQAKFDELKDSLLPDAYAQRVEFFNKAREMTLGEFLEREPTLARNHLGNVQTRQLLRHHVTGDLNDTHLAEALENLQACDVVGLLERLPESIALLEHRMGWEGLGPIGYHNVNRERPARQEVDPAALEVLTSWNRLDIALYQKARELFEARLEDMQTGSGAGALDLPSAAAFTPAQPIHGHSWYPREQADGRWICWMGAAPYAWVDLAVETLRDSLLTCEFPYAISPLALNLLQIQVNGLPVEHQRGASSSGGNNVYTCKVPAAHLQLAPRRARITFICHDRQRPCDIDAGSRDLRRLSLALGGIRLVPVD